MPYGAEAVFSRRIGEYLDTAVSGIDHEAFGPCADYLHAKQIDVELFDFGELFSCPAFHRYVMYTLDRHIFTPLLFLIMEFLYLAVNILVPKDLVLFIQRDENRVFS